MSSKLSYNGKDKSRQRKESKITNRKFLGRPKGKQDTASYIPLFKDTVEHPKFLKLSFQAQALYFHFATRCGANKKDNPYHDRCLFPKSEYIKFGFTGNSFIKCKKELLNAGFIEQQRTTARGATVRYHLSDNWYRYEEVPEEKQYYD